MGLQHPAVIASRPFVWRVALKIELDEIGELGLAQAVLPHLGGIFATGHGAGLGIRELACLVYRERAVGPDGEAPHSAADPFLEDKRLPPFGDTQRKPRKLGISHKHLAR